MLNRLALKIALGLIGAVIGIAVLATGVYYLCAALANAMITYLGPINGDLATSGILLLPFLLAILVLALKLRKAAVPASSPVSHTIARTLFDAVAREAPWIAAAGAAAVAAGEVFLNRKKPH